MIGFTVLGLSLLIIGGNAQDYRQGRGSIGSYDDDELTYEKPTTPVPILKQIDRHNDDGSYTYGFESADGSFKIETKEANGEVRGKYGYTDANGKLHVVEYGANKFGFMPSGEGITVPPVNYDVEPEPELEQQQIAPRPYKVKQGKRPLPRPAPAAYQPWEQEPIQVAPPVPQLLSRTTARPQNTPPHIVYNSAPAPVPKRPAFFAGAQPLPTEDSQNIPYSHEPLSIPQPRSQNIPARPQRPRYTSSPVPARTEVQFAQPESAPAPAPSFIPSPQFSHAIQFSDPRSPQPVKSYRAEAPQQYFRPEPAKAQITRYVEPEPSYQEEEPARPAAYLPRAASPPRPKSGGFLDQLREQYALPQQPGHATHDISFGYY